MYKGTTMQADLAVGMLTGAVDDLAVDVARIGIVLVNVYLLGKPREPWVLVDTGMPNYDSWIEAAVAERWGAEARPEAIILTHGHLDHAGSARTLATRWDVPIYVHPMEMPFVTGVSDYPPQDPTVGGAFAFVSRFLPHNGQQLGDRVRPLPADGTVPQGTYRCSASATVA
jgi:glyoxylase-like metal-dependent hydrolase (beta-lactamase superfamily II)